MNSRDLLLLLLCVGLGLLHVRLPIRRHANPPENPLESAGGQGFHVRIVKITNKSDYPMTVRQEPSGEEIHILPSLYDDPDMDTIGKISWLSVKMTNFSIGGNHYVVVRFRDNPERHYYAGPGEIVLNRLADPRETIMYSGLVEQVEWIWHYGPDRMLPISDTAKHQDERLYQDQEASRASRSKAKSDDQLLREGWIKSEGRFYKSVRRQVVSGSWAPSFIYYDETVAQRL
ncbi:uncharacterized protein EV422DRAFT_526261 [Fimicolochytrium jonesii]|uniref:uncharacterized protein n=1 Tax=Fimicolochytrium jonesii TaxID=1396493 RepID=UPI0022FF0B80|nr:uncharacterized protein EV422DRAFT_526261 [Fimicolochytrium jonesii]KAI8821611.1 hypothetical protein EV422DRAFT_526261 [Fimicolochytrium jonesii]